MSQQSDDVELKFKGGGSVVSLPPVFSEDAASILVAHKDVILKYNTRTAMRVLEYRGLSSAVVGFGCADFRRQGAVVACSRDGTIAIWHADTGFRLETFKLKATVSYFKVLRGESRGVSEAFLVLTHENKKRRKYKFAVLDLESHNIQMQSLKLKLKKEIFVDASDSGGYFVAVQENKLYFNRFGGKNGSVYTIREKHFTCVNCHPELECVLTGDNVGRVVLWHGLTGRPSQAVFHWHTLPVRTLRFSTSGTHFYSGGSECTLVKWQADDNVYKNFLPRLPSILEHVAVARDNLLIAIATADNAIQIVDAHFKPVSVIQHLVLGSDRSTDIVYDPRSKAIVLNGTVGHVQFYSPKDMTLFCNLDVVGQNKYTDERTTNIINTSVTKVAVDKAGQWTATVECRDDPEFLESRLKFWFFDAAQQNFTLNTCVEDPHEEGTIDAAFRPSNNINIDDLKCVTLGKDRKFKVWRIVDVSSVDRNGCAWRCFSAVSYRDLMPNALAFATDGSLLAVAFDSIVTTWLPNSCKIKCSLRHPSQCEDLLHVSFGVSTQCHLLVSASSRHVSVWNLLTLTMTWTVPVDVSLVISDALTSYKAVFTKQKKIFVFEPDSPNPIYASDRILENVGDIQAAAFIPSSDGGSNTRSSWCRRSNIYLVDSNQEMHSIEMSESDDDSTSVRKESTKNSLLGYVLPKVKSGSNTNSRVDHLYRKDTRMKKIDEFLSASAHTMAPLHLVCEAILHSMVLESRKADEPSPGEKEEENAENQQSRNKDKRPRVSDEDRSMPLSKVNLKSTTWMTVFE